MWLEEDVYVHQRQEETRRIPSLCIKDEEENAAEDLNGTKDSVKDNAEAEGPPNGMAKMPELSDDEDDFIVSSTPDSGSHDPERQGTLSTKRKKKSTDVGGGRNTKRVKCAHLPNDDSTPSHSCIEYCSYGDPNSEGFYIMKWVNSLKSQGYL